MKNTELDKKAPDWSKHNMLARILHCKSMLYLHGFMIESEWDQINKRINKWVNKIMKDQQVSEIIEKKPWTKDEGEA